MIKYEDVVSYLQDEYPDTTDVMGLISDLVNGVTSLDELKQTIVEYREHNG